MHINNTDSYWTHVNLVNGFQLSDCKLPCKIVKIKSKFQGSLASSIYSGISVAFKADIKVITTRSVKAYICVQHITLLGYRLLIEPYSISLNHDSSARKMAYI